MKQPTLGDAVLFVLQHRKGNSFKGLSENQIAQLITNSLDKSCLVTSMNKEGELVGIVCAIPYMREKKLFIHEILTTEDWVLKDFVIYFALKFSGWSLEAMRRGKFVEYNTVKLMNKILKKEKV